MMSPHDIEMEDFSNFFIDIIYPTTRYLNAQQIALFHRCEGRNVVQSLEDDEENDLERYVQGNASEAWKKMARGGLLKGNCK